jgi:hypothetical protein
METNPKVKITVEAKVAPKARPASEVLDDLREMNRIAAEDGEGPIKQISEAISTIGRLRSRLLVCQVELDESRKREAMAADLVREQVRLANKIQTTVRACIRDGHVGNGERSTLVNDLHAALQRANAAKKPLTVDQAMEVAGRTDQPNLWLGTIIAIVCEADAIRLRAAGREAGGGVVPAPARPVAVEIEKALCAAKAFEFENARRVDLLQSREWCDLVCALDNAMRAAGYLNA